MPLFTGHSFRVLICTLLFALSCSSAWADGELDTSFGNGSGKMAYSIISADPLTTPGVPPWSQVSPFKVLALSNGRSLVLANTAKPYDLPISASNVITVVRIKANGELDASYGTAGRAVIEVGEDYSWYGNDAVLLSGDSVAIIGTIDNPDNSSDMAVWKITSSGAPDNAFGIGGLRRLRRGGLPSDAGKAIALATVDFDGPVEVLVVAGNVRDGLSGNHSLGAMLLSSVNGIVCQGVLLCGNVVGGDVGLDTEWMMLRIDTYLCPDNGDIEVADLTAFTTYVGLHIPIVLRGCGNTAVVKQTLIYSSSHTWGLDSSYGNNGRFLISFGPGFKTVANAIAHAPVGGTLGDMSYVVAGYRTNADGSQPVMLVARSDPWNSDVTATYDFQATSSPYLSPGAYADSVLVQSDGRVLLGGGYAQSTFTYGDAAIMRLTPDLQPDNSFGGLAASLPGRNGYGHYGNGSDRDNRLNSMAFTADGKLVFAGYMYNSDDGASRYGSVMRVVLQPGASFHDGFE